MANTFHDQLTGSDLHENKVYPATGTPLPSWVQTDARYAQQMRSITTAGPLVGGGNLSADRTLSIPAATGSQDGYLTAADWATFSAKGNHAEYVVGPTGSTGNDYTANGTTDDVALRNALQSNRTIFVRNGTYNLTNPINLAGKSNIRLIAESLNVVFQIPQSALANFHFSYMILGDATSADITVEGIRLYGNYSNYVSPLTSYGGGIAPQTRWVVQDCVIEDFPYFGLWLGATCSYTRILRNRFVGPGHGEDHIGGGSANYIEIAYNTWESNIAGNAWDNVKGSHYYVHHNVNKSGHNFYAEGVTHTHIHHNDFPGGGGISLLSDNGYGPASITNCSNSSIRDNHLNGGGIVYTCTNSATKAATVGGNVSITGNIIDRPDYFGILLQADSADVSAWGTNYLVANNTVHNANATNSASYNTGHGIIAPSGINITQLKGIVVANNACVDDRATPQQRYGIQIGQTFSPSSTTEPNGVVLSGNYVSGYVTAPTVRVSPTYTTDYFEITGTNGAYQFGGNLALTTANGKITAPTGVSIEEAGDVFGTARMSVQNRSGVNGVLLEQAGTPDLVEVVFKGLSNQANLRYENRGGGYVGTPEFQVGTASDPSQVISDTGTLIRKGYLKVAGDTLVIATAKTPTSATSSGTAGQIAWDANYVYVCVATNTWKRVAITSW